MIARVLRIDVAPERIDLIVAAYRDGVRPVHARADGLLHHYLLADREKGRIEFVGVWRSPEAVAAIASELEPARERLWASFDESPALDVYDVVDELPDPAELAGPVSR
jgi:hypothetical protein